MGKHLQRCSPNTKKSHPDTEKDFVNNKCVSFFILHSNSFIYVGDVDSINFFTMYAEHLWSFFCGTPFPKWFLSYCILERRMEF